MDQMKKRKIIFIGICVMCFFFIVLFFWYHAMRSNTTNHMYGKNLFYYEQITSSKDNEILLEDVFQFEWEKAFIQNDSNEEAIILNKKLGFEANIAKLDYWWGYPCRIVFVKNSSVVFEFKYDANYIDFGQKDIFVYPNTRLLKTGREPLFLSVID